MTKRQIERWRNNGRWLAYRNPGERGYRPCPLTLAGLDHFTDSAAKSKLTIEEQIQCLHEFQKGYHLAKKRREKAEAVLLKYKAILEGAYAAAKKAVEGKTFDMYCGRAITYVGNYDHELARALWAAKEVRAPDHWSSRMHAATIEIPAPSDGQSMTGWEESAKAAAVYLQSHGIPANWHSWAD